MSEKCFWCEGNETLVLAARGRSPERVVKCLCSVIPENRRLREALEEAAKSLQTIASQAGRDEMMMKDMMDVRGYADSRARAARAALTPPAKEVPSE